MKCLRFLSAFWLFCLLFAPCLVYAQDAQPDPLSLQQMTVSSQLRQALLDSKRQMNIAENYSNSLQTKIDSLMKRSEADAEELTSLSNSLTSTMASFRSASDALQNSNILLEAEKSKNAALMKMLLTGTILFFINMAAKALLQILHAKGIKLPYWAALWI